DLWHAIHQDSAYMPGSRNSSYLLTIHDLNFLEEKSQPKAKLRLKNLQKKADRAQAITCISKFTESVVKQHLQLNNKLVTTIYNGVEDITNFPKQRPPFLQKNEPFLFAMGVIKSKKNFHVLVDFLSALPTKYKLILAGNKAGTYSKEIEELAAIKGLKDKFVVCGTVSPSEKAYLYANCEAFLFPSKCEGFGLPVIEAMQFGKPVFLSTYSSLPEIGGLHAFYWQTFDPDYMAAFFTESMKYFYDTPNMAAHMMEYSKTFSWKKNAAQYLDLYSQLLKAK
ncbi:MAG: glycosyltransferase family 4 protein, partial [Bacteroidia bacterium]